MVIVGAGFGGLTCARALKRAAVDVLLVDANNYHLFTPLLYQVASSLLDPSQIAQAVRSLIRPLKNCDFRLARVRGADFERRLLRTDAGDLAYDYLVLAAGSESNFFGNAEVEAHAIGLKELPDGLALRNWVLGCFEAAAQASSDEERRRLLTFAVVGGGPTGVEYAGALQELTHLVLRKDYPRLDLSLARIVLIEGTGSLLGAFDPRLREAAARSLKRKDVEVWFDAMVATADQDGVALKDGRRLDARTVVWTAGVKASDLGAALGCGAYLSGLTRTAVGPMTLADAVAMATLTEAGETWTRWLLPMDLPLRGWPVIALDAAAAAAIRRGQTVDAPSAASGRCRVLDADGHLLAWGEVDINRRLQPRAVFPS